MCPCAAPAHRGLSVPAATIVRRQVRVYLHTPYSHQTVHTKPFHNPFMKLPTRPRPLIWYGSWILLAVLSVVLLIALSTVSVT